MRFPSTLFDRIISEFDIALRAMAPPKERAVLRPSPAVAIPDSPLTATESKHVAGLMRVNHAGEVCAQALYQGQAFTAQSPTVKKQMHLAAREEIDHLGWCETRLTELNAKPSLLNPLWYTGSFCLGALAGLVSDQVSLGFVAETEHQVSTHLQEHMTKLPPHDHKTQAILQQMEQDEAEHAQMALDAGGLQLPKLIRQLMGYMAKYLTVGSYYM